MAKKPISCKFNTFDSLTDFEMYIQSIKITPPALQSEFVEIPGGTIIDMATLMDGRPKFGRARLDISFSFKRNATVDYNAVANLLHGNKFKIFLDDRPNNYYWGIVTVETYDPYQAFPGLTISVNCDPWLYEVSDYRLEINTEKAAKIDVGRDATSLKIWNHRGSAGPLTVTVDNGSAQSIVSKTELYPLSVSVPRGVHTIKLTYSGSGTSTAYAMVKVSRKMLV